MTLFASTTTIAPNSGGVAPQYSLSLDNESTNIQHNRFGSQMHVDVETTITVTLFPRDLEHLARPMAEAEGHMRHLCGLPGMPLLASRHCLHTVR